MNIDTIRQAFGSRPFTPAEAAVVLGTPNPGPTLAALKTRGWIERSARGTYRVRPAEDRALILERYWNERARNILEIPLRVALDGPDAARVWTRGAYNVGDTPGSRTLYLAVDPRDETLLRSVLAEAQVRTGSPDEPPGGSGLKVVLRPWKGFSKKYRDGSPVIPLDELRRIANEAPLAYEGFEEWVRE